MQSAIPRPLPNYIAAKVGLNAGVKAVQGFGQVVIEENAARNLRLTLMFDRRE